MARNLQGLQLREWAESAPANLLATPEDEGIARSTGLPAGFGVDQFVDLAMWNQIWREITAFSKDVEQHGILEWNANVEPSYAHPCVVFGSDNILYKSVQSGGEAQDPTTDTNQTYWEPFTTGTPSSTTARGIIRTATPGEHRGGTATTPATTPAGMLDALRNGAEFQGTTARKGALRLATDGQHTQSNPPGDLAATPQGVEQAIENSVGVINGIAGEVDSKTANYTVVEDDRGKVIQVSATGGARTVTLPNLASTDDGFTVTIMKNDSSDNAVTIEGDGTDTINGESDYDLDRQYEAVTLKWTASEWLAIGSANDAAGGVGATAFFSRAEASLLSLTNMRVAICSGNYAASNANAKILAIAFGTATQVGASTGRWSANIRVDGTDILPFNAQLDSSVINRAGGFYFIAIYEPGDTGSKSYEINAIEQAGDVRIQSAGLALLELDDATPFEQLTTTQSDPGNTWTDVADVTIDVPSGGVVTLWSVIQASVETTLNTAPIFRIQRGTTTIWTGFSYSQSVRWFDSPGAGSHTYTLQRRNTDALAGTNLLATLS